jgi:hypothetical protein
MPPPLRPSEHRPTTDAAGLATLRVVSLVLAAGLLATSCTGGSAGSGGADRPTATTSPRDRVVEVRALEGRRFWYGDEEGTLFEVRLERASIHARGDRRTVIVEGSARNLLGAAASFTPEGRLATGGKEITLAPEGGRPVPALGSGPLRLVAEDVPANASLAEAILTFGAPGTTRSIVPLASGAHVTSEAPHVEDLSGMRGVGELAPGTSLELMRSVIYPRYGSDRTDERRQELTFHLAVPDGGAVHGLYLHPSLIDAGGVEQSIGDQNVFPPGATLLEHAILTPASGSWETITFLEVQTNARETFHLDVPGREGR